MWSISPAATDARSSSPRAALRASREPPLERSVEGAQPQRLGTFGPAGPSAQVPGVGVDVRPWRGRRDELGEVERRDDRTGEARLRNVVEVGDLAVEQLAVGLPERQAPERIVLRRA